MVKRIHTKMLLLGLILVLVLAAGAEAGLTNQIDGIINRASLKKVRFAVKVVNPETGKIHNVSPHKLRDAFAVHAVKTDDSGDGLRLLQEHLGHASFNTTARYRKVGGREHRDWYEKLWREQGRY